MPRGFISQKFKDESLEVWKKLMPYKCVFAYKGEINPTWLNDIKSLSKKQNLLYNDLPDLIVVNKIGMIEKVVKKDMVTFQFALFKDYENNIGIPFSSMLYNLNNFCWEEFYLSQNLNII